MSKKGGKAPAAPDYTQAAKEQGTANLEALRTGAALNRVNQTGPTGSTSYKNLGGDQWEQTTTLSPEQQRILDSQQQNQIDLGRISGQRLNAAGSQMAQPLNFSGQPSRVSGVNPSQFRTDVTSPGTRYQDIDLGRLSNFGNANVQGSVDFSGAPARADASYQSGVDLNGLPAIPGANDFGGERQKVEDAVYSRATSDLDPQYQQREDAMRTRLLNSGNTEGSEAWKNETGNFERERAGAYDQARNSAILAGGNEQSRLLADALSARNTMSNERFNQGQFANSAADSKNAYGLAARGQATGEATTAGNFANSASNQINSRADSNRAQQMAELLSQGNFGNSAASQNLQAELAKLGVFNQAQTDKFSQGVTNANLNNASRDSGISEQMTLRNQPLQDFLQLYGASASPNTGQPGVPQVGSPEAPNLFGATDAQYQAAMDAYNAKSASNSGMFGSLAGLAGNLGSAWIQRSDERFKEGIEQIGELPQGVGLYEYSYKDDPHHERQTGVMAQELEKVQPDAVLKDRQGYRSVDYRKVLARALMEAA